MWGGCVHTPRLCMFRSPQLPVRTIYMALGLSPLHLLCNDFIFVWALCPWWVVYTKRVGHSVTLIDAHISLSTQNTFFNQLWVYTFLRFLSYAAFYCVYIYLFTIVCTHWSLVPIMWPLVWHIDVFLMLFCMRPTYGCRYIEWHSLQCSSFTCGLYLWYGLIQVQDQ